MRVIRALVLTAGLLWLCYAVIPWPLVVGGDSLAVPLTQLGVRAPSVGWGLVGALLGGLAGLFIGLRRAGRPVSRGWLRALNTLVVVALLLAGSGMSDAMRVSGRSSSGPTVARSRVTAMSLSVRVAPRTDARVLTRRGINDLLTIVDSTSDGRWYAVLVPIGPREVRGYVARAYVTPPMLNAWPPSVRVPVTREAPAPSRLPQRQVAADTRVPADAAPAESSDTVATEAPNDSAAAACQAAIADSMRTGGAPPRCRS